MAQSSAIEIAQKLHLPVDAVNKSNAIKNTYDKIKNDPSLSEEEKDEIYEEMASIYKTMMP